MANLCDVCNKNESVGVACVPGVPISMAYCRECLQVNAHPYYVLVANTAMCGGLDQMNDEWKGMVTDTCKHLGKTIEQFNLDVQDDIKKLEELRYSRVWP